MRICRLSCFSSSRAHLCVPRRNGTHASPSFGENTAPTLALLLRRSETRKNAEAEDASRVRSLHPRVPSPAIAAEAVKPRSCPRSVSPNVSTAQITAKEANLCCRQVFLRLHQAASSTFGAPCVLSARQQASCLAAMPGCPATSVASLLRLPITPDSVTRSWRYRATAPVRSQRKRTFGFAKPRKQLSARLRRLQASCASSLRRLQAASSCNLVCHATKRPTALRASGSLGVMPHATRHLRCRSAGRAALRSALCPASHLQPTFGGLPVSRRGPACPSVTPAGDLTTPAHRSIPTQPRHHPHHQAEKVAATHPGKPRCMA